MRAHQQLHNLHFSKLNLAVNFKRLAFEDVGQGREKRLISFMGDFLRSGIRNKQVSDIESFLILPKLRKILHTLPGPTHERIQSI